MALRCLRRILSRLLVLESRWFRVFARLVRFDLGSL
jgi:hypothetical protein